MRRQRKAALKKSCRRRSKRLAALKAAAKANVTSNNTGATNPTTKAPTTKAPIVKAPVVKKETASILVTDENRALNTSFRANMGNLSWPVSGRILMHYGRNELPSGSTIVLNNTTIATEIGAPVKAIFGGVVSLVMEDESGTVVIQHGGYFTTYSNISNVTVKRGQQVSVGQVLGKAMANLEGIGAVDFFLQDENKYYDPEKWLHR
ncbi:MAG: peptidoglycan DD-metalloendopeptidase family protein [Chitinophagaceae bacterium]|nr:peptidoglycan DD-metalloendopeptidase family protein [Chitinophagaceae bacterium]